MTICEGAPGNATTGSVPSPADEVTRAVHVGRQPLYDRPGNVVGYELLFRGDFEALSATRRNAMATSQVLIAAFTDFGLPQLVGDRLCFVNLTREFLVGELPLPFEPENAVLEVLETVLIDDEVYAGCQDLVERGYALAMDDFVWTPENARMLPLVSYVKLDMLDNDMETLRAAVKRCRQYPNMRLVAERLETEERLAQAVSLGFDLFQGYILGRPHVITSRGLNPSRLRRLELLTALTAEDVEIPQVVELVRSDAALSLRLLRATNSAASGMSQEVSSIRDAVVLLGLRRVREWVGLMIVSDLCDATEDQLSTTLVRARLCQTAAEHLGLPTEQAFTVGLLSGVADLVEEPISEIVGRIPLSDEVTAALTTGDGPLGRVLSTVRAYESVDLGTVDSGGVDPVEMARAYLSALGWSNSLLAAVNETK